MPDMKILDAYQRPAVTMLRIKCSCGCIFEARADSGTFVCSYCAKTEKPVTLTCVGRR